MPFTMTANSILFDVSFSGATATMSVGASYTFSCGFYTVSGDSLILVNSGTTSFGYTNDTNASGSFAGQRYLMFVSSQFSSLPVFSQGVEYFDAINYTSAGASTIASLNFMGFAAYSTANIQRSGLFGSAANAATTVGFAPFFGAYSNTTTGMPNVIANNEIRKVTALDLVLAHVILNNNPSLSAF